MNKKKELRQGTPPSRAAGYRPPAAARSIERDVPEALSSPVIAPVPQAPDLDPRPLAASPALVLDAPVLRVAASSPHANAAARAPSPHPGARDPGLACRTQKRTKLDSSVLGITDCDVTFSTHLKSIAMSVLRGY